MNRTAERLEAYGGFSPDVVDVVADVAERQQSYTHFQDYFVDRNVQPPTVVEVPYRGGYVEVLDLPPIDDSQYDEKHAVAVHLPMANPLSPNMIFQILTMQEANPGSRFLAVGNPSGARGRLGSILDYNDMKKVKKGSLAPVVEPILRIMDTKGIETADHVGGSLGAELAAEAPTHANHVVERTVHIDPIRVKGYIFPHTNLGVRFALSGLKMNDYVRVSGAPAFTKAFKSPPGLIASNLGLLRTTNRAIVDALCEENSFAGALKRSFDLQRIIAGNKSAGDVAMSALIAWASKSLLAVDGNVFRAVRDVRTGNKVPNDVRAHRIDGEGHAMTNDIYLGAALVTEGLSS